MNSTSYPSPGQNLIGLRQRHLDWLRRSGVNIQSLIFSRYHQPSAIQLGYGEVAPDGRFDFSEDGEAWLAFDIFDGFMEPVDIGFWQPRTGELATSEGRTFALGQEIVDDPATYSFDCRLNIFADPLQWLQADRDGIVVVDWSLAFDRLRDVPRIAVDETLILQYRRHMQPPKGPEVFVIAGRRVAA
ncbi:MULTISPECIES: hypothetical protein [Mesorhizobium]|uniref:Uncharacterized protein n=1 Tax=Mesorhizobium denitrificans TaxID=2294114 RepID=A0A371XH28_9HYPH|nr:MULTISPECIES: hypothetical protein [Mesorhizobium]RFC68354.1 hypothetical protein DY251_05065 [Mesorhizobium denitrificans]